MSFKRRDSEELSGVPGGEKEKKKREVERGVERKRLLLRDWRNVKRTGKRASCQKTMPKENGGIEFARPGGTKA